MKLDGNISTRHNFSFLAKPPAVKLRGERVLAKKEDKKRLPERPQKAPGSPFLDSFSLLF